MQPQTPPGPQGHFLTGSISEFAANPPQFLVNTIQQHGDITYFKLLHQPVYHLAHPDYVRDVLVTKASSFAKDELGRRILGKFLGNGLLTSEGSYHKRQRRLAQPAFHHKRIQAYADVMVSYAQDMLATWQSGQVHHIDDDMMRLTMFIVSKTLFDADVSAAAETAGQAIQTLQTVSNGDFRRAFPLPDWLPTRSNRQRRQAIADLNQIINQIIAERRHSGEDKGDLLSMLLLAQDEDGSQMTEQQLRDEVVTLFAAGHETTANVMTWMWYLLSQHPEVEAKLHAELDHILAGRVPTLADLPSLPYSLMVIKETMRLYPPAWILSGRIAVEDVEIGNYLIPQGSRIFISPYAMHRQPQYFPQPEQFNPDRWLPENEAALPKYAYIPFGGGARVCIGNSFAMMEAHLLLAAIAQQYRLSLVPGHKVVPEALITMSPEFGMNMQVTKRDVVTEAAWPATAVPHLIPA
ncbi:MAG: cytochrome P450 [Ardenticatenaceae bacterium]|nr:cytochrome P450 [Ardenticatenaceae bacterium]